MRSFKLAILTLAALLLPTLSLAQVGTGLTSTTLSATIGHGTTSFQLASVTGISGFGPGINNSVGGTASGPGNITDIYIDRELMQVVSVNTAGKTITVLRGQGGSQASAHLTGTSVLIGPPGAFFNYDPEGYCGTSTTIGAGSQSQPPQYNPWVNQRTSNQWICSTVSSVWVPGIGNPGVSGTPITTTTLVASAATLVPSGPLFHVSGTTAIVTISVPYGNKGQITIIFDGVDTWTAAGNISIAGTNTTAGTSVTFTWEPNTSKWVPSRVA